MTHGGQIAFSNFFLSRVLGPLIQMTMHMQEGRWMAWAHIRASPGLAPDSQAAHDLEVKAT